MKKVKNPHVGDLVQIPVYCFEPFRSGWNGWIFRIGTIEKLGKTKDGTKAAKVKFCASTAGRNQMLPCQETFKTLPLSNVFQFESLELYSRNYAELKAAEDAGEDVCWGQDMAFLVNNGFIGR